MPPASVPAPTVLWYEQWLPCYPHSSASRALLRVPDQPGPGVMDRLAFQTNFEIFQTWFHDDGIILSPLKYGEEGHLTMLKYMFFCFQHVGLKISTHKMKIMQSDFEFLGVWGPFLIKFRGTQIFSNVLAVN